MQGHFSRRVDRVERLAPGKRQLLAQSLAQILQKDDAPSAPTTWPSFITGTATTTDLTPADLATTVSPIDSFPAIKIGK